MTKQEIEELVKCVVPEPSPEGFAVWRCEEMIESGVESIYFLLHCAPTKGYIAVQKTYVVDGAIPMVRVLLKLPKKYHDGMSIRQKTINLGHGSVLNQLLASQWPQYLLENLENVVRDRYGSRVSELERKLTKKRERLEGCSETTANVKRQIRDHNNSVRRKDKLELKEKLQILRQKGWSRDDFMQAVDEIICSEIMCA